MSGTMDRMQPKAAAAPTILWGLAAALILLAMPVGLVETLVASSGLSEALPAAAPPLGLKARLLLAAFGALMAIGAFWASPGQKQENGRCQGVAGVKKMGFALPKLSWLARNRGTGASRGARPAFRRADAHPDAPARTPIFASRDFRGIDIFPRISSGHVDDAQAEQPATVPMISAASGHDPIDAEFEEITEPTPSLVNDPQPAAQDGAMPAQAPSIAELTERLEQGLARRARVMRRERAPVIADMPVEQAVPVRSHVEDEADEALRLALGTLRALVERTR